MEGLLKPSSDFIFKNWLTDCQEENKRELMRILNEILKYKPPINSITLLNSEYKKNRKNGRFATLNIEAVTNDDIILYTEFRFLNGNLMNISLSLIE